jgi:hypothetical protein
MAIHNDNDNDDSMSQMYQDLLEEVENGTEQLTKTHESS